jgi:hypothetical protein
MVAVMDANEQTLNVEAEKWLEEQFNKFDFDGFNETDKTEVYAVFMNTMRPATYGMFDEAEGNYQLIQRQGKLLTGVVNALRGEPGPLSSHSHHDAPLLAMDAAEKVKAAIQTLQTLNGFIENLTLKAVIKEALRELGPRHCPNCDKVEITSAMKDEKFGYLSPEGVVELTVNMRVFTCYSCEQMWTDLSGEAAQELAVAKYRGIKPS